MMIIILINEILLTIPLLIILLKIPVSLYLFEPLQSVDVLTTNTVLLNINFVTIIENAEQFGFSKTEMTEIKLMESLAS